jgi:MFS family permease
MLRPVVSEPRPRFHRNVLAAGWVSFLTDFSSDMIYPLLPLFLKSVLHTSASFIGLIEGAAETTASLLKLASGWMSDRWRRRKSLVLLGYGLSSVARPLVALAGAGWHVLAVRVADRVGKGLRTSPRDALVAESTPAADRGRAFGFQRAMDHAGAFVGPLVAAGLLWFLTAHRSVAHETALRWVFALAAIPGLLALAVIGLLMRDIAAPPPASRAAAGPVVFGRDFRVYLGAVVLFALGNSSDAFLVLRAVDAGLAEWQVPLLWAAFHAVKSLSSTPAGGLSDRLGRKPLVLAGWGLYAACYALFGVASAAWQIVAIFLVYGLYHGCVEGTERALVADLVPAASRGTAYGWFHAVTGLAALPASLLFGALWDLTGTATVPLLTGAGLALAAALVLARVRLPRAAAA